MSKHTFIAGYKIILLHTQLSKYEVAFIICQFE